MLANAVPQIQQLNPQYTGYYIYEHTHDDEKKLFQSSIQRTREYTETNYFREKYGYGEEEKTRKILEEINKRLEVLNVMEKIGRSAGSSGFYSRSSDSSCSYGDNAYLFLEDIQSMKEGKEVNIAILDMWATLMNVASFMSGTKFIFNCSSCSIYLTGGADSFRAALKEFFKNQEMSNEMNNLKDTKMFFLPINESGHYTMFVVNTDRKTCQYLDNLPMNDVK